MQDLEFTVERGKLYMLQTRNGKRSAEAAVKIALRFGARGLIAKEEASASRERASLDQLFLARIDPDSNRTKRSRAGLNASPGAAAGADRVRSPTRAAERGKRGKDVILVRIETDARRRARHDRGEGHADRAGRRDLARGGRRARHGQAVRLPAATR